MRGEREARGPAAGRRQRGERGPHPVGVGLDEPRMIVEDAQLVDDGGAGANLGLRPRDVLQVLAASRVRAVRGGDERERPRDAVPHHRAERVGQERVPVPVAPVERQAQAVGAELLAKGVQERPVLGVDRADAGETLVVVRDLALALGWHAPPPQHVVQERRDVRHPLRPPERDEEKGVVGHGAVHAAVEPPLAFIATRPRAAAVEA